MKTIGPLVTTRAIDARGEPNGAEPLKTDPTGRYFVSYRRSRADEIERLVPLLHEHGIPTWQDKQNLAAEATVEAIQKALECHSTAGAILWLSTDVAKSDIIRQEEAPRILKRARADAGFAAELCVADGLGYGDVTNVLNLPGSMEDPSKTWNLHRIEGIPASDPALLAVTHAALARRLKAIHGVLNPDAPLRLSLHAHSQARPAFELGRALIVDWTPHFQQRHAAAAAWDSRLLPALAAIVDAIRTSAPRRAVLAEGYLSITSAFALGRAFMEPCGIPIAWNQFPKGELWSLGQSDSDSGFAPSLFSQDVGANDLAVLVSIRDDVEPAVTATASSLPSFRAILRVQGDKGHRTHIATPDQASRTARLVGNQIRQARDKYPVIRKTHLFYSGPAGIALMIGQQLNAVGPVQLYEHQQTSEDAVGTYVPSALLCDMKPCN